MLKEAIEKIASMAENKTYTINERTYSDKQIFLVDEPRYTPKEITIFGLGSLVSLIQAEHVKIIAPLFVEVEGYNKVCAYSALNDRLERHFLYKAISDTPDFSGNWMEYNSAMIFFRSQFIPNAGTEYILDLLSRITDENSLSSSDNGLSQTVEVKKGISLKAKEAVKARVLLRPYRTFKEVEQPESEFLLRLSEDGRIGLFEADGGMWKLKAKDSIYERLCAGLQCEIKSGKVIVMR